VQYALVHIAYVDGTQKHGGKITADIPRADYVILTTRSTTFHSLFSEAMRWDKPIVQGQFIHDCIDEGKLLNPGDYQLEILDSPKVHGRKPTSAIKKEVAKPDTVGKSPSHLLEYSPLAEPPPPASPMKNGRFLFTNDEREYCWRYVRRQLESDPTTSSVFLAKQMFEIVCFIAVVSLIYIDHLMSKMPHHSLVSWTQMIRRHDWVKELKDELTPHREGHIEGTGDLEGTNDTEGVTVAHHMSDQEGTSTHKAPVLPDEEHPGLSNNKAFEEDFETIVDFLVSGEADSGGEDEVWAILSHRVRLSSMHMFPHLTKPSA